MSKIRKIQRREAIEEVVKRIFSPNSLASIEKGHKLREEVIFR